MTDHKHHNEITLTTEQRDFLLTDTRTGKLATVRKDGRSHVVPIWFVLDGNEIVFTTGQKAVKAANIRRDNRVCLCVDDQTPPFSYATVEGIAEIDEEPDLDNLLHWATRIGGRYMGAGRAEEYGRRNGVPGEVLVRIKPTKIMFEQDVAN